MEPEEVKRQCGTHKGENILRYQLILGKLEELEVVVLR